MIRLSGTEKGIRDIIEGLTRRGEVGTGMTSDYVKTVSSKSTAQKVKPLISVEGRTN